MRARSVGALLVALLAVAVQVEQSPHLVHHFFEHGTSAEVCALAVAPDRLPGLEHAPVLPEPDLAVQPLPPTDPPARRALAARLATAPRAPPPTA
jgi:hypothetical protein